MIDFHTHIMPYIDDGSDSIEESCELLREAVETGFTGIVLTPHFIEGYYETVNEEKEQIIQSLMDELEARNININLYEGNEVYFTENILELLENKKISSINNSKYVLFELPFDTKPISLQNFVDSLMQNNYIPILAHPERYRFVKKDPNLIYELVKSGVLMQANYGSILGVYGNKSKIIIKKLLENNLVHFLGTDVHKEQTMYNCVPEAIEKIEKIVGREKLEELTTINQMQVLKDKYIEIDEPTQIKLSFTEKMKLNSKK